MTDTATPVLTGLVPWLESSFEAHAHRQAVTCEGAALTHRELDARSAGVSRALARRGVRPGDRVAIHIEPGIDLVVAVVGVLRAGAAYVPLDVDSPAARLDLILADAQPALVVHAGRSLGREGVDVREVAPVAGYGGADGPVAYVIYTSGSTGTPKGVIVTPHNVARLFTSTAAWFRFGPSDRISLFHSIAFDFSVWELFGALLHGATCVMVPSAVRRDAPALRDLLRRERVTVLSQTPSAFFALAEADLRCADRLPLRTVVFGGEKLPFYKLRRWRAKYGDTPALINMYGITETTVHSTYHRVTDEDIAGGGRSLIGEPLPDTTLAVLDPQGRRVGRGETGELYVGGEGVSQGYLNRAELTAARFLDTPRGRVYRSGDVCRIGEDGRLEYVARNDQQVKIRGFRIETGEIEAALLDHPAVMQAVVRKVGDELVAWVTPGAPDVVAHARARLPSYMVPRVVPVAAIAMTDNGKIDVARLEALAPACKGGPPVDEREAAVAAAFTAVLGHDVGREDDWFDLGGDSIRVLELIGALESAGWTTRLDDVYRRSTVSGLAAALVLRAPEAPIPPFGLVAEDRASFPADAVDAWPMTSLQRGMFYEGLRAPGRGVYHDVYSFRVRVRPDPDALERAVASLVARHPMLRTSFHLHGFGAPVAIVHATAAIRVAWASGDVLDAAAARRSQDWDPTRPGLWQIRAFATGDETQLEISFHHAILDGWSLMTLAAELVRAYRGEDLPPAPDLSFAHTVAHEQAVDPAALERWRARLARPFEGALPAPLPAAPVAGAVAGNLLHLAALGRVPDSPVVVADVPVDDALGRRLRARASALRVPLQALLLTVHAHVISALTGRSAIRTGVVTHGRPERAGAERAVGLFLNTVPVDLSLVPGASWDDHAAATFDALRDVLVDRRVPHARLAELGGAFESAFNFVEFHPLAALDREGLVDWAASFYFEANELVLVPYFMVDATGRLTLRVYGRSDRYDAGTIAQVGRRYHRALSALAEDRAPDLRDPAEAVVARWAIGEPAPPVRDVSAALALTAARWPDRVALEDGERRVTYAELARWTSRIAARFRPGQRVAVTVPRSIGFVAAWLGVLEAGACVVPVDPTLPERRVAELLVGTDAVLADATDDGPEAAGHEPYDPTSLAYIVHTSGSTGTPKGVGVTRGNLAAFVAAASVVRHRPDDRVLSSFSTQFDGFVWELLQTLCAGATLVLLPRDAAPPPDITAMTVTPSMLRALSPSAFPALRLLMVAGEALHPAVLRGWTVPEVWNLYGPTEATIACAGGRVDGPVTLGRPLPGCRTYVVTEGGELAAPGVPGELWIGGDGVSVGYLRDPALTAARFVDDPRLGRVYRSGDIVSWSATGELVYHGRRDAQVKLRGWRLDLGEVEAALRSAPGVTDAVAAVIDDTLVGCVVGGDPSEVEAHVAALLPSAIRPSRVVALASLPVDRNGKRDRKALVLPAPEDTGVAPRTATELAVLDAMSAVLGRRMPGVTADFRGMGGDSLRTLDLLTRLEGAFGVRVPIDQLRTAESAAAAIDAGARPASVVLADGDGPALFFVHPAVRTVLCYRDLAARLGRRFVGLEGGGGEATSLPAMAAAYVAEIRRLQPVGPYHLGGWSAGGTIAAEMAAQLEADGEQVAQLVLLDSRPFSSPSQAAVARRLTEPLAAARLVLRFLAKAVGTDVPPPDSVDAAIVAARTLLPAAAADALFTHFHGEILRIGQLGAAHLARPVRAPVLLLVASDPAEDASLAFEGDDPLLGWGPLAPDLTVRAVPGSHETMLYPPDAVVAALQAPAGR